MSPVGGADCRGATHGAHASCLSSTDSSRVAKYLRHPGPPSAPAWMWMLGKFLNSCDFLVQMTDRCKSEGFPWQPQPSRAPPSNSQDSFADPVFSLHVPQTLCRTLGCPGENNTLNVS